MQLDRASAMRSMHAKAQRLFFVEHATKSFRQAMQLAARRHPRLARAAGILQTGSLSEDTENPDSGVDDLTPDSSDTPADDDPRCKGCGAALDADDEFCGACGLKVEGRNNDSDTEDSDDPDSGGREADDPNDDDCDPAEDDDCDDEDDDEKKKESSRMKQTKAEEQLNALARSRAARDRIPFAEAYVRVLRENSQLYVEYLQQARQATFSR
jgi:hypothetical protein